MTFTITRAQFEAARKRLTDSGIEGLVGDSGTLSHSGVTISFVFNEPALDLEVVKKPFFIKEGYIEDQINGWFKTEQV